MDETTTCPLCGATNARVAERCHSCGEMLVATVPAHVRYTPARAYRLAVLPFAALLILHAIVMLAVAAFRLLPITHIPFVHGALAQRAVLATAGAVHVAFAIGFILRSRLLWKTFFAYLFVGTWFGAFGSVFDPPGGFDTIEGLAIGLSGLLINGAVAVGLYFATRPAFTSAPAGPSG